MKPWQAIAFEVACVGKHFECWRRDYGLQPVPSEFVAELEPATREYRRGALVDHPRAWRVVPATFRRYPDGRAAPACSFDFPPHLGGRDGAVGTPLVERATRVAGG
ncbi:MAG: hypothetical protein ACRDQ2_03880 [Gaiellales bacterium]